ncbi:toll/interleukin-1 receptor-like protein [Lycium ferocissimum]|uniref:toll/interleukin-1 receptor-like protein n=1 Tax=Lycium ferocissimum TaxID=112874 RepID=UPI002815CAE5|nr:toll/interleukin-1 receptor-like protein [Lycium ferocissimum]
MASSSSSASNLQYRPPFKYDVFLSFIGFDIGNTFAAHLYQGLKNRGIVTFKDDKMLDHGYSVEEQILKAIEVSQFALVIFSRGYASSSWCLNELVKIMECKDKSGLTVIPVFYHMDPLHVRMQSGNFADAFAEHELRYKDEGMQKDKMSGEHNGAKHSKMEQNRAKIEQAALSGSTCCSMLCMQHLRVALAAACCACEWHLLQHVLHAGHFCPQFVPVLELTP